MDDDAHATVHRSRSLAEWLDYQQTVHPRGIELGLDRVREVWRRLGEPAPAPIVITVAGTNGKGSTVAFLEAMLAATGLRVGCYTSPHLLRYNERVRIAAHEAGDGELVAAFERIEAARGATPLTYFELGTLAALLLFADGALDVVVLEVGLGGRLDAVNLIDADVAIITTIDHDHEEWLGHSIERIALEKAGIFRRGRVAVIGDGSATAVLREAAHQAGAEVLIAGEDYHVVASALGWQWRRGDDRLELPPPALAAPCQQANAAAALAALHALRARIAWDPQAMARAVGGVRLPGRLQRFGGTPELIVDVAHNPQAARVLAEWLRENPPQGRDRAVFSALGDKDIEGIVQVLGASLTHWYLAGLDQDTPRGLDAGSLRARVGTVAAAAALSEHDDVVSALTAARVECGPGDRIIAFGSFFVAAQALALAQRDALVEI
jgi:dihydrofolate synthase/folylpolyglutamate synthase